MHQPRTSACVHILRKSATLRELTQDAHFYVYNSMNTKKYGSLFLMNDLSNLKTPYLPNNDVYKVIINMINLDFYLLDYLSGNTTNEISRVLM